MLSRCIADDQGARLFTDKDIEKLSGKSAKALNRLFDAAQELNAISKEEQEAIKKKMSERGRDYFIMSLAYSLGMTRRQLLNSLDSYELTMWSEFFQEMNNPKPKQPKLKKADTEQQLKGVLMAKSRKHA